MNKLNPMKKKEVFAMMLVAASAAMGQEGIRISDELRPWPFASENVNKAEVESVFHLDDAILQPPNVNWIYQSQDYEVGIYDFTAFDNLSQSEERMTPLATSSGVAGMWAMAPVHFEDGDELATMTFWGADTTLAGGMIVELRKKDMETNVVEVVATVKTFEPTVPVLSDSEGNPMWTTYAGSYPHAFDHYYWPAEPMIHLADRSVTVEMNHQVESTATYFVYLYTLGEVEPEKVEFWSLSWQGQ
ncbi:MAG: hypothetical protein AAGC74_10275 [Verrucomicrobiota bacterium]